MSFLTTIFQHATVIASGSDPPGSIGVLENIGHSPASEDAECTRARYSFLRLIGCAYYKQHTSAFRTQTPEALFHSMKRGSSIYDHHNSWLANIRNTVRQRVYTDSKSMPPTEALLLHWKRCKWVLAMWNCATKNSVDLPGMCSITIDKALFTLYMYMCTCNIHVFLLPLITEMTQYGWKRENGKLEIDWEVTENIDKAKASLDFILSGCKCKTGCKTRICSCRKKERECGPSCCCHFCTNTCNETQTQIHTPSHEIDLVVDELIQENENNDDAYVEDSEDDLEEWHHKEMDGDEKLRTLVEFVFGSESDKED